MKKSKNHQIMKSSGELEKFSASKLQRSLKRTGLSLKDCKKIAQQVSSNIHHETKSKDIYKQALMLVSKKSKIAATHYSLKKSLLGLGPTGFEFEFFISKYFEAIGYETFVGVILQGEFVKHEVDVIGSKPNYQVYAECKFHNMVGRKNDIKVALYVKARWDDLKNGPDGKYLREFYLVSNTAFTTDAITYSKGCGLRLLGVNAPGDESLLDKIKRYKLYPITSLKNLSKKNKQELISRKIILCSDLLNEEKLLLKMGMSSLEVKNIMSDVQQLLNQRK